MAGSQTDQLQVRVGIDVGGTFTHAVALDAGTGELLHAERVPTTHTAAEGVARGVQEALTALLAEASLKPFQIAFIAHSTTQATNALLEGDVATVGVLAVGSGLEGRKVRADTDTGDIPLGEGKRIRVVHVYLDETSLDDTPNGLSKTLDQLRQQGVAVIVAASAYSVDDASEELHLMEAATAAGLLACGTHQVSSLYGLRARTRTCAVNASILPKMVEAARSTERCVKEAGITAPLMIMRSDGGVMSVDEMSRRPILTLLSGPAAGVAAALMHVKIADGLFIEVGGTSTDISAMVDGKPQVRTAEVGGHRLYLRTLDVRTVGIAGGSMPRIRNGGLAEVGPRSAHIAGLPYFAFTAPTPAEVTVEVASPLPSDPQEYIVLKPGAKRLAFTTTCASRTLNGQASTSGAEAIGKLVGAAAHEVCREVLRLAASKATPIVSQLAQEYGLSGARLRLIGGGGGAEALVPSVASELSLPHEVCKDAAVISAIGVALAMVREVAERTIPNPTDTDIAAIRAEAKALAMRSGATEQSIEVQVEVDKRSGVLRATATGSLSFSSATERAPLSADDLLARAGQTLGVAPKEIAQVGHHHVFQAEVEHKGFLGLGRSVQRPTSVLDDFGAVKLHRDNAIVRTCLPSELRAVLEQFSQYGDAGMILPAAHLLLGEKLLDLSGLASLEQVLSLVEVEIGPEAVGDSLAVVIDQ